MKTADLTGATLDWAVAKCELLNGANYTLAVDKDIDGTLRVNFGGMYPEWSSDWQEAGAIIERKNISVMFSFDLGVWVSAIGELWVPEEGGIHGTTPLIAAMRCYVASKLGTEIEVPEELLSCADE